MILVSSFSSDSFRPVLDSYYGDGDYPVIMAYTDCYGDESQLANCSGFYYDPFIPSFYCDNGGHVAGVECQGEITGVAWRLLELPGDYWGVLDIIEVSWRLLASTRVY